MALHLLFIKPTYSFSYPYHTQIALSSTVVKDSMKHQNLFCAFYYCLTNFIMPVEVFLICRMQQTSQTSLAETPIVA